jgi:hypothetical protein
MDSDLLDEYCDNQFGHMDWEILSDADGNLMVTFFKEPREGYVPDDDEGDLK